MKFDEFAKTYEADIRAFFEAFVNLIKTLYEKFFSQNTQN